jgi:hypothetical protein
MFWTFRLISIVFCPLLSSNAAALRAQQMAFASGGFSGGGFGSDESLSFYVRPAILT